MRLPNAEVAFFYIFAYKRIENGDMKRILVTLCIMAFAATAYSQPRSAGIRLGVTGVEANYHHTMKKNQFLECGLGMDLGVNAKGIPGMKATAIYNFIWANPAWTEKGKWTIYSGPGVTMGYVHDNVHYKEGKEIVSYYDGGFMLGVCAEVGVEYTFWFPLQLSIDLRPSFAMHASSGPRVGFYDNGLLGFSPHISARYCF